MKIIWVIFLKELKETLRDRRTLMTMLVIPIVMFPIILTLFVSISEAFQDENANKKIKIAICNESPSFIQKLSEVPNEVLGNHELIFYSDSSSIVQAVHQEKAEIGLYTNGQFEKCFQQKTPAKLLLFFNATEIGMKDKGEAIVNYIAEKEKNKRLNELEIQQETLTPIDLTSVNTASPKEMIGQYGGAILPYLFIAFGFLGCMYPSIDLFTGEKERGTIETILTTPVKRWQILLGKMKVVVLSGLSASTFGLIGLWVSIEFMDIVKDPLILNIVNDILSFSFVLGLFGLLIPLIIFFAGVMIPVSIYSKSFKEAQSIITPLNIVMVLPAMVGFFPGIELNMITACIPVVNVVLASKELIAGTLEYNFYGISFFIMCTIASVAVVMSFRQYGKETNVVL